MCMALPQKEAPARVVSSSLNVCQAVPSLIVECAQEAAPRRDRVDRDPTGMWVGSRTPPDNITNQVVSDAQQPLPRASRGTGLSAEKGGPSRACHSCQLGPGLSPWTDPRASDEAASSPAACRPEGPFTVALGNASSRWLQQSLQQGLACLMTCQQMQACAGLVILSLARFLCAIS